MAEEVMSSIPVPVQLTRTGRRRARSILMDVDSVYLFRYAVADMAPLYVLDNQGGDVRTFERYTDVPEFIFLSIQTSEFPMCTE